MGKKNKNSVVSVFTPVTSQLMDFSESDQPLSYWKQILPEGSINYEGRTLTFDHAYNTDLSEAFNAGAYPQTAFVLADKDNAHTMDPERYRGEITAMRTAEGDEKPGLYARIRFASKKAAQAVLSNPNLGVSARINEGVEKADGRSFKRAIVHVLGTLDPKVTNLSPWKAALDLSSERGGVVIDLSGAEYEEEDFTMAKKNTVDLSTSAVMTKPIEDVTDEEIDALSDEELAEFMARMAAETDDVVTDGPDDEEDESGDEDDSTEDPQDDPSDDKNGDTELSNKAQRQIDLANSQSLAAGARADEALRMLAAAEWKAERADYLRQGCPPAIVDLATPVLSRHGGFTIDLSNSAGKKEELDVAKLVREMLDATAGFVDLSEEAGHSGNDNDGKGDPDADALAAWNTQFGK